MKKKLILYLMLALTVLLASSCATKMYYTTLDVLKPAQVTFPLNVNNVVIVNNAVPQPANVGHHNTTLYGNRTSETLRFDSAGIFITAALRDGLKAKSFFNRVELSLVNQNTVKDHNSVGKLSGAQINSLCKMYNADAVIAVNRINIQDEIFEYYNGGSEEFYNDLEVKVKTDWAVFYPDKKVQNIQFLDSFLWQSGDYNRVRSRDKLPKRYDALVDASILTGTNVAARMIPRWEKEDRVFFSSGNKQMTQAMDSVSKTNWAGAIELWKNAAATAKNAKIKYQSFHNIANAYEIKGDMDKAIEYAKRALDTYSESTNTRDNDGYIIATSYQNLINRKKEMDLIKRQLGNY